MNIIPYLTNNLKQDKYTCLTSSDMITAVEFLLYNIYAQYGNSVCRQRVGIPMGTYALLSLQIYFHIVMNHSL